MKIKFHPKNFQQKIIDAYNDTSIHTLVVTCARQLGKSFTIRYLITTTLLKYKGIQLGYVCPTNKLCSEIFDALKKILPKQLVFHVNSSSKEITLLNGSRIQFLSGQALDNYRGLTLQTLFIDECAFTRQYFGQQHFFYHILSPFLDEARSKGRSKLVLISTPNGAQGFFYEQYLKAINNEPGFAYVKTTLYDDETKSAEFIKEKRDSLPDLVFQQEYMCQFLTNGVSCFKNFENCKVGEVTLQTAKYAGIDWSSTGSDNTVMTVSDGKNFKTFIIEGEFDEKYEAIAKISQRFHVEKIIAETNSMGSAMINEIKKRVSANVISFNTSNSSKQEIILALMQAFERGEIFYDSEILFEELKVFIAKKTKTGLTTYMALDGYHDDTVMSLAFCLKATQERTSNVGIRVFNR